MSFLALAQYAAMFYTIRINTRLLDHSVGRLSSFCPLIMTAGRPRKADPGTLYAFAHMFYWELRQLAEGAIRQRFNAPEYETRAAEIGKMELELTPTQETHIEALAEAEIRCGRLEVQEKAQWLRNAKASQLTATRDWLCRLEADKATKQLRVPGEPEIITELLKAETPSQVREICNDAFSVVNREVAPGVIRELAIPNWPIPVGSTLPSYLSQYATEFIAAKKDSRFPMSTDRPTSRLKQLWFLSRALAGASYGVKTRTAINLVGSKRPEESFEDSNAAKPVRRRAKVSVKRRRKAGKK